LERVSLREALVTILEGVQSLLLYSDRCKMHHPAIKDLEDVINRLWLVGMRDE
jgi:hypothetical protein